MKFTASRIARLYLMAFFAVAASKLDAAMIVYGFDNAQATPTVNAPNVTGSALSGVDECSATSGNPGGECGTSSNSGSPGTNFASLTITPSAGFALDLVSFSFDQENLTSRGPTGFAVYTSSDGFTTPVLSGPLAPNATSYTNESVALSGSQYQNLTAPFAIRISGYGGPTGGDLGYLFLDNLTLNLTTPDVTATPEPSFWLPTAALLGILMLRQRPSSWRRGSGSSGRSC